MISTHLNLLSDRFGEALSYAFQLHAQQLRKDGKTPYISHLLSVAALVLEDGGDEDEAIAALLHDAVEDQGVTIATLRERFGDRVATIVNGCSEQRVAGQTWQQRKQSYLDHLQQSSPEVCRVSLADKLHNLRSLVADLEMNGEVVWQRFNSPKANQLWYYQSLSTIFQARSHSSMSKAFAQLVHQLDH
jgi:(p)ppGpp synthase/HD superfamily hydrolase